MKRLTCLILGAVALSCQSRDAGAPEYDDSAVTRLLAVFDSIAAHHPGYERQLIGLDSRTPEQRRALLDSLQAVNERNAAQRTIQES
jgi:hypothetical protein